MEKLEEALKEVEARKEQNPGTIYQGLKLIEEKPYQGPTSIMYWM